MANPLAEGGGKALVNAAPSIEGAPTEAKGVTPMANVGALLEGTVSEPEVDPRAGRRGLELVARAFREIGSLKTDVGKLKQQI